MLSSSTAARLATTSFSSLKFGNAVDQQPADAVVAVVDGDLVALLPELLGDGEAGGAGADNAHALRLRSVFGLTGFTQPCSKAVSTIYFSTAPMVTDSKPFSITQLPSQRRSCGQIRPQISGMLLVEDAIS